MLSSDRTHFSTCHICNIFLIKEGKYIYIIGGKIEGTTTK